MNYTKDDYLIAKIRGEVLQFCSSRGQLWRVEGKRKIPIFVVAPSPYHNPYRDITPDDIIQPETFEQWKARMEKESE